ncbi:MAG: Ig-like domain-containing protein [Xanthomonadaceae bacterium]|nr:Ig-like domain-containing protein [Xanthomonadaceae bacterium]
MAALLLVGCSTDPEQSRAVPVEIPTTPDGAPITRIGPTANFDPSAGVVPTPNNLLYSGSVDGTLNIPVANPADFTNPQVAINALDGWSTNAPIVTTFSNAVDPTTVIAGNSVKMFEVTLSGVGGAVTSIVRQLAANEFVTVMATPTTLVILPIRPLAQKSHYAIAVTDSIADADGGHVVASQIYAIIKNPDPLVVDGESTTVLPLASAQALEPLRQLNNARETAIAAAAGISRDRIVLSWTVSTQSVTDVIDHVAANVAPAANAFAPTGMTTAAVGGAGLANIYFGYIDLPYYLQAPGDVAPADPTRVTFGHWEGAGGSNLTRFNPAPVARSTQRVPAILTVPVAAAPAAGYPVMVFQHGITGNRTHALAIADAAAQAGRAVLSIDQPLHGLPNDAASATFPFYAQNPGGVHATPGFAATERHFNVDLVNNTTSAPGPDGTIDGSGTHTINLQRLLTSRDNLRQATADLLTVFATIPSLTTVDAQPFDETAIHFVGHSLGAMVGIAAVGASADISTASYKAPGGGIARLLHGSATFGPRIQAGLAAAGVAFPSAAYDSFMFAAQTVVDSADPLNHAGRAAASAPSHMMLVVGDGAANLPDQVVPITVAGAPLSGGNPLAAVMGLQAITETTVNAAGLRGVVRFTAGDHGSLISPVASPAATVEMQGQVATFMATFGTTIPVANPAVVQQP